MDIESKQWRLQSDGFGGAFALHKQSGVQMALELSELPSLAALSAMSESQFDALLKRKAESM